jgi:purine-binding chemotaxis protein CheW
MKDKRLRARQEERTAVDWSEVHRRLLNARSGIERALTPAPDEKKRVLKARARELAQEIGEKSASEATVEVVELLLAQEAYGIESSYVREVYPLKGYTPLPGTPSFVLGIINVRGQIVSVVDLRRFFGLPEMEINERSKVMIVRNDGMEFGILADAIRGVRSIKLEEIQPPLPTLTGIRAEYLRGVTSERLAVLDAEKILSDRKMVIHEEVEL